MGAAEVGVATTLSGRVAQGLLRLIVIAEKPWLPVGSGPGIA